MCPGNFDISKYQLDYIAEYGRDLSFDAIIAKVRQRHVMLQIGKYGSENILEIGCGIDPLFRYLAGYKNFTIIEPAIKFVQIARKIARNTGEVKIIRGYFEDVVKRGDIKKGDFDMIILSSLLHEVSDPGEFLKSIRSICKKNTVVHINVPNVYSFHRLLAMEAGIITDVFEKSETEKRFQRRTRFDRETLMDMVQKSGFVVKDFGTYLVKPFTNSQMEALLKQEIINMDIIYGLDSLVKYMPEMGCEMYVNLKLRSGSKSR
jgi:2-polyprenyl-3-methyl-5-hydroxy-6-metoxy-1,4-benzoquinol methylase